MRSNEESIRRIVGTVGSDALLGVTETEECAVFPDGSAMGNCTNCARRVVELLGRGEVWGFSADSNPKAESVDGCSGHDFAVVDDRYIVDVWISLYTGRVKQIVFDLDANADQPEINRLYGDRSTWEPPGPKHLIRPE